jgi:lipopolysaccharide export LptBFGC system permease protein LptF
LRLQWYIFGIVARSFLVTLVLVTGTVFLVGTLQSFSRYDELSLGLLLSRLPYLVPFALTLAVPLALLVGTLFAYGRLSADNEILAMRMGGIHPFRAVTPALALGLALTVLMVWMNGTVSPWANGKAREITLDDLNNFLESLQSRPRHEFHSDRVDLEWRDASPEGVLLDVSIDLRPEDRPPIRGAAGSVSIRKAPDLQYLVFRLHDFVATGEGKFVAEGRDSPVTIDVDSFFGRGGGRERLSVLTSHELLLRIHRDALLGKPPDDHRLLELRTEYAARISLAFACFVFILVGAPLGMLFRHGSFVGAGLVAILVAFVLYYPLHEVGRKLGSEGVVPVGLAMSLPGGVVGGIGLALLVRVLKR